MHWINWGRWLAVVLAGVTLYIAIHTFVLPLDTPTIGVTLAMIFGYLVFVEPWINEPIGEDAADAEEGA